MYRKVKKVERALSLKNRKKVSLPEEIPLPQPRFEFEDTLVTQLRATDILSNCHDEYVLHNNGDLHMEQSLKRTVVRKHPFHHDNNLMPVWQAFYSLDKKGTGNVLLGRLMTLTSLVGNILNPTILKEKTIHSHFIGTSNVAFNDFRKFIERAVSQNTPSNIDWKKLRAICWTHCENWYLQSMPFDIPGELPQDLYQSLYWLWCTFNQIAENDTYPPSADHEEIELLLRKLFSSLGILWEDFDDGMSSSSSVSSPNFLEHNGIMSNGSVKSNEKLGSSLTRLMEDETMVEDEDDDDYGPATTETFLVTFQQFLTIISDMLGSETVLSAAFGRAVTQVYLSEVDEIVKTGWLYLKKPGADTWRKRWTVLRRHRMEFYSDPLCGPIKFQITLNQRMNVESLPASSSYKHRFRLVEREGDMNIAWESEMSSPDSQHFYSWMLVINLTVKINSTGLSAKKIELAERKLERHRRRESEFSAIEKRREARKTRRKLMDVRERWNAMQDKLKERAAAREQALEMVQKMDEIYDKLQTVTKKQSLIRKTSSRIRSAFPSMSSDSGIEMTKDERSLLKTRDEKLLEQNEKMDKLEEEKIALQQQLVDLQASAILSTDEDRTLILVYGPERELGNTEQPISKNRANSLAVPSNPTRNHHKKRTQTYHNGPSALRKTHNKVPAISISTSALTKSPSSISKSGTVTLDTTYSVSHPALHNDALHMENGSLRNHRVRTTTWSSIDSDASSVASQERLV